MSVKETKFISSTSYVTGLSDSALAKRETNDCVVRAVATAFVLSYDEAHTWVAETFKRKPRKGTSGCRLFFSNAVQQSKLIHGKEIKQVGDSATGCLKTVYGINKWNMTVGTFLKMYQKGTFLVFVRRHAFVILNGVVIGNAEDAARLRVRVQRVYEVL
jgi:hypothetical protein